MTIVILCAAIGCGLVSGIFFAFSTFVMRALARLEPAAGIGAMQWINRTVINPWFLGAFLGTGAICFVLSVVSLTNWQDVRSVYVLAGSASYLIGTLLVTIVINVPMNDALERVEPTSSDGEAYWARYLRSWTVWNHVRTIAALVAAALLTLSIG